MIVVNSISKSYGTLPVLKEVSLTINRGEIVSIVGPSGAGKTTLLQIIGTLLSPDSGSVSIDNRVVTDLGEKSLSRFRNREIGFIFQFHNLLPEFSALENIAIPGYISGKRKSVIDERAMELLKSMGLEDRAYHKPSELSGGEQQRVAVARALINNPSVILADEPTGSLDSVNRKELYKIINMLRDTYNYTFVIVTHDDHFSEQCDRTIHLEDGVVVDSKSNLI